MTVSTFVPTAAGNQSVNTYTGAIDGDMSVLTRLGVAFAPHAQAVPNMTVAVDAGHIFNGTILTEVSPQTTATIAAPSTNPRIDRVVIDRLTGVVSVVNGTESATPVAPAFPAGTVPVARVLLQPGMTVITNDVITDERSLYSLGSSAASGGLLNVQTFATPGTYTYTPTVGTTKVIVEVQGAGGQGGIANNMNQNGPGPVAAGGGASGAYAKSFLTSNFSGITVVVGAGGFDAIVGLDSGESSSFGTITAPGGVFGANSSAKSSLPPPLASMNSFPAGSDTLAAGGNMLNTRCGLGAPGLILGSMDNEQDGMCQILGGAGAASKFGPGGPGGFVSTSLQSSAGKTAISPGAGGGGGMAPASRVVNAPGGRGGDGIVIVYEYA